MGFHEANPLVRTYRDGAAVGGGEHPAGDAEGAEEEHPDGGEAGEQSGAGVPGTVKRESGERREGSKLT